ncbi:Ycf49-like protein [Capsicum chinense]|nr:Ycf49-like protein [Capsicum chinense]
MVGSDAACASEIGVMGSSLQFNEPSNALSLPTWAIHVSSVVEWITAMALVWQYGEKSGNASWKGLSWGMASKVEVSLSLHSVDAGITSVSIKKLGSFTMKFLNRHD